MEKITCTIYFVIINLVICFGQSHKTSIPINTIKDTSVEIDNAFLTLNFGDFFLYYSPDEPFVLPIHNITDSSQILLSVVFCLKNSAKKDYLKIKSVKFQYIDDNLELSRKDRLKIINHTLTSLKEKNYYIKYHDDVKQDWNYFMCIPVIIIPQDK